MSVFGTEEWLCGIHRQILNNPFFFFSGYNQIFIIPVGATSIRIKEVMPSRNFLGKTDARTCASVHLDSRIALKFGFQIHQALGCLPWGLDMAEGKTLWKTGSEYWVSLKCQWCSSLGFSVTSFSLLRWSCCWVGNKKTQPCSDFLPGTYTESSWYSRIWLWVLLVA